MSRSGALFISFCENSRKHVYSTEFIGNLINKGWVANQKREQSYLKLGGLDEFDWTSSSINSNELLEIVAKKIANQESPFGCEMLLFSLDQRYGHDMCVYADNHIMIILVEPEILLEEYPPSIDISKYTKALFEFFIENGYDIKSYQFSYD